MTPDFNSSGFYNDAENTVRPSGASSIELLPYQSKFSLVYKIRVQDRWLLLKRLKPEFRNHAAHLAAMEKEFDLGFKFDHPHIVKYLNKGVDNEGPYLIAEYVDGIPLRELLKVNQNKLKDKKLAIKIFHQILDALEYLHKQQVFHLDLKPENILITNKGNNVKLIDFDMALSDSYLPVSSGTMKYCAPEQLNSPHLADARSDFYALALVFLEMLTGNTEKEGIRKLPLKLRTAVSKCLVPLQKDRYQSAEELRAAFLPKKKSYKWVYVLSFLLVIILFVVIKKYPVMFGDGSGNNNKELIIPHQVDKNKHGDSLGYGVLLAESKRKLDSLAIEQDGILNSPLSENDSILMVNLGTQLYSDFLSAVNSYDKNPGVRNRKLVLIELRDSIVDNSLMRHDEILAKYKLGSVQYVKLSDVYRKHADESEHKIDKLIFGK